VALAQETIDAKKEGKAFSNPYGCYYEEDETPPAHLEIVKDAGVYLMSGVEESELSRGLNEEGEKLPLVEYAQGFGPNVELGGDDYVEVLEISDKGLAMLVKGATLQVVITEDAIEMDILPA